MKLRKYIFLTLLLVFGYQVLNAQDTDALGTFTPYSLYGIGDLSKTSSSISKGMGGVGIGIRDSRYININNIASITARDTLSFMLDFGINSKNVYMKDKFGKSAYNGVNINNLTMSIPIVAQKTAIMFGISPYSNIGYKFQTTETDPNLVYKYGDIKYRKYGEGSISEVVAGIATIPIKGLSVGVKAIYYFGNLRYNSNIIFNTDPSFRPIETGWQYRSNGFSAEIGGQYFISREEYTYTIGATYRLKSKLKGDLDRFAYAKEELTKDTILFTSNLYRQNIPSAIGFGFSVKKGDKWTIGADYQRQDWSKTEFRATPGVSFKSQTSHSFNVGIEWIPNRYDIRYFYKRMSYRAGFHYDKSYINLNGNSINTIGLTLGLSIPVFRLNNTINIAVDIGQRGSKKNNLVKENYVNFIFSFSLHDIWFIKPKYQ